MLESLNLTNLDYTHYLTEGLKVGFLLVFSISFIGLSIYYAIKLINV